MNIIEYWRARRAMKALLKVIASPKETTELINAYGEGIKGILHALQGEPQPPVIDPGPALSPLALPRYEKPNRQAPASSPEEK